LTVPVKARFIEHYWCLIVVTVALVSQLASFSIADEQADYVPQRTAYPPHNSGVYLAGELVVVDPINRRGGIRLNGDGNHQRYLNGPLHYFAMLPCGEVWYNGGPATLRDIPLGTHVQGYFYVPPAGEEETIPPAPQGYEKLIPKHNHAVFLEDDFSFYRRRGQSWKIASVDFEVNKLHVESIGKAAKDGLTGKQTFDFDRTTRVWKSGKPVEMEDVKPGTIVQMNFGWAAGWQDGELGLNDIWLDDESRAQATELQRRRNVRYHRIRWLPGRIETVEHFDYGGGLVTISLFGGVAKQIHDELEAAKDKRVAVAAAEHTLRTWRHRSDRKFGKILQWETVENPRPGFSGIRIHMKFTELIDHYRPGNAVRIKSDDWIFVSVPPEERIKSLEDREQAKKLRLP
jgi:hypothetical protein